MRGKLTYDEYKPYFLSLRKIKKRFPHLYLGKISKKLKKSNNNKKITKKKNKSSNKINISVIKSEKNNYLNDVEFITQQYESIKNMGSNIINGQKRSSRNNKGQQPDRYIDDHFIEIFLEDSKIEEVLESGSDVDTDYHSSDNFSNEESDGEWDENYGSYSESDCLDDNDNED